jgi:hypothetical protein
MAILTNNKIRFILIGILLICIIVVLAIIGSHRSPSEISENKFVDVYVQLSLADELYASDSLKAMEEREKIYRQAKVTPEEMDSFVKEQRQQPERWERIWKKIMQKLESGPKMPK